MNEQSRASHPCQQCKGLYMSIEELKANLMHRVRAAEKYAGTRAGAAARDKAVELKSRLAAAHREYAAHVQTGSPPFFSNT